MRGETLGAGAERVSVEGLLGWYAKTEVGTKMQARKAGGEAFATVPAETSLAVQWLRLSSQGKGHEFNPWLGN